MADFVSPPGSWAEHLEDAKVAEHQIAKDARNKGADVFEFDPNATPQQKAEQVKKAIPAGLNLPSLSKITTDIGTNGTNETNGVLKASNGINGGNGSVAPTPTSAVAPKDPEMVNGCPKAGDGDWSRVGWEPRFGTLNDALGLGDAVQDHQTFVEANLDDKFFGDWYHNAGIILFTSLATWFLTLIGGGLGWIMIIMACCATYYRTSMRRVRRNVRDDLNREFAKRRMDTDVESLEWINTFTTKFWPIYQPVLAAAVVNTVDQVLAGATPGFIDSLKLTTFTLGTKPPRIEHVKSYPKTDDDIVQMEWKFSFTPNDTADLTRRELSRKVNPKIVLEVRVGKGIASKGIPIIVEDMAFSGVMKIKINLQIAFPHIEKVEVCFVEPPTFDYALKPLGGETFGIDIGFLPGLSGFIQDQIHSNLRPMFYEPNVFTVEVAKMLAGAPVDTAIGVLAVTIHHANGLKNPDKFSGTPDPYAVLSINNRTEVARTKIIKESTNPKWKETKYIIITNFNDPLTLGIFDFNEIRKDRELGIATFALDTLAVNPEQGDVAMPVMSNGKARGQVACDLRFFPIMEGRILEDGTQEPVESNTGILRWTVSQAKELDASKSMVGQLSPYACQLLNSKLVHKTKIIKRTNDPVWEDAYEMLITDRQASKLEIVIKDDRDLAADPELGRYAIKLDEMLGMTKKGTNWFNLSGVKSGRVKLSAEWKPVTIKGVSGTGGYQTPIGVMRLHFLNGENLRNLEALGKSDAYVRVLLSGVERGRTVTFENDLNPKWDEVLYVPIHSPGETLHLEVMDHEKMGKDRSLGFVDIVASEYVQKGENGLYMEHSEKANTTRGLKDGKGTEKGSLNFTAAFYPCLNIADPEEEEEDKKIQEEIDMEKAKELEEAQALKGDNPDPIAVENAKEKDLNEENTITVTSPAGSGKNSTTIPKVRLTPEELVKYDSGLLIFKIIEGQLAHKDCYIEVLMDDMLYPAYATTRIKAKKVKIDEIGDAFVRELEFSKVTIRLREHGKEIDDESDDVLANLQGNTLETLKQCLNNPTVLSLRDKNGEISEVTISLKYVPVLMRLDPSESINNMGTVRVDILDAANLPSADRNGKSDPFCVFKLDDKEIHKTKVQKKTLHPAWNEVFETKVTSRTAANFAVEIFDWDLGSKADLLCKGPIDLKDLEPFIPQVVVLKLNGKKGEEGKFGEIRLRILFRADYVVRSRQGSSTFHGTFATPGKIVTGVAGAPLKVGGFAAGGITKGASFLKKNTFGRAKKDSNDGEEEVMMMEEPLVRSSTNGGASLSAASAAVEGKVTPPSTAGQDDGRTPRRSALSPPSTGASSGSPHNRSRSVSSTLSAPGTAAPGAEPGVATVRIVSATGFPTSANVRLRFKTTGNNKELHKSKSVRKSTGELFWDEEFMFQCTADQQFKVCAEDDHLIRADEELGEGLFVVDDTGSGGETVVSVGQGKVTLRTSFKSADMVSNASPKNSRRGLLKK
ncbi:C2 domain-containing protein [Morchella snyderi]|nr:C2 domain-containing protein [Morchella snyderi]